jgi:hypothetical protein
MTASSFDLGDLLFRIRAAWTVDAHVVDGTVVVGCFVDLEELVEAGDAVGLGRRNLQLVGDVVQAAGADPASFALKRMERREQLVAQAVTATGASTDKALMLHDDATLVAEHSIDRGDFACGCLCVGELEVGHVSPVVANRERLILRPQMQRRDGTA